MLIAFSLKLSLELQSMLCLVWVQSSYLTGLTSRYASFLLKTFISHYHSLFICFQKAKGLSTLNCYGFCSSPILSSFWLVFLHGALCVPIYPVPCGIFCKLNKYSVKLVRLIKATDIKYQYRFASVPHP